MWVVPVFSVSLFPSSSVFWLNYDCNEPLNYNIGPKEQEMIFKDRINFLIIFGCNSPVCLSVYLSAATLGQLVEREGWRANKKLTIVVCFYLFVRIFAFSSRNLMAPGWCQILEPSESTNWGADETYRHISAAAPAFLLSLHGIRFVPAKPFALSFQPLVKQVLRRQRERESCLLLRFLTLVTQPPNPMGETLEKALLLGAAASTFLHPCLSFPSPHPPPTPPRYRTNSPVPPDFGGVFHRLWEDLLHKAGKNYQYHKTQLINNIISLHSSPKSWIFHSACKWCQNAGCAWWLVKFIPFCGLSIPRLINESYV